MGWRSASCRGRHPDKRGSIIKFAAASNQIADGPDLDAKDLKLSGRDGSTTEEPYRGIK